MRMLCVGSLLDWLLSQFLANMQGIKHACKAAAFMMDVYCGPTRRKTSRMPFPHNKRHLFFVVLRSPSATCTLPASITPSAGYVTSGCGGTIAESACSLSCDTSGGYAGSPSVTCSAPGDFSVAGACLRMCWHQHFVLSIFISFT